MRFDILRSSQIGNKSNERAVESDCHEKELFVVFVGFSRKRKTKSKSEIGEGEMAVKYFIVSCEKFRSYFISE